jgi:hypothetical protein
MGPLLTRRKPKMEARLAKSAQISPARSRNWQQCLYFCGNIEGESDENGPARFPVPLTATKFAGVLPQRAPVTAPEPEPCRARKLRPATVRTCGNSACPRRTPRLSPHDHRAIPGQLHEAHTYVAEQETPLPEALPRTTTPPGLNGETSRADRGPRPDQGGKDSTAQTGRSRERYPSRKATGRIPLPASVGDKLCLSYNGTGVAAHIDQITSGIIMGAQTTVARSLA